MLTQEEKDFVQYWEQNRSRQKKIFRQFLIGIPVGLLFVIPIAINFRSGWYRRADMEANNGEFNPLVLAVALLLIIGFTAIFYQRHKWDQYEQRYQELLCRRSDEEQDPPGKLSAQVPHAPSRPTAEPDYALPQLPPSHESESHREPPQDAPPFTAHP